MFDKDGNMWLHMSDCACFIHFKKDGQIIISSEATDKFGNNLHHVDKNREMDGRDVWYIPYWTLKIEGNVVKRWEYDDVYGVCLLGNGKIFEHYKKTKCFIIRDCASMGVIFESEPLKALFVDENIIEFNGKTLDTDTMKYVDSPSFNEVVTDVNTVEITKYHGSAVKIPKFTYESGKPYAFIFENYLFAYTKLTPVESSEIITFMYRDKYSSFEIWRINLKPLHTKPALHC